MEPWIVLLAWDQKVKLTNTQVAVDQWRKEFLEWTTVDPKSIYVLTADSKTPIPEAVSTSRPPSPRRSSSTKPL